MKTLLLWVVVFAVILGSAIAIVRIAKAPTTEGGSVPEIIATDRTKGPSDAKVVLVEYSDFQCPACGAFFPQIEKLNEELDGKILFVYRHFPLPQHKNGELAAVASEAAGKQGKFWEMYRELFRNQTEWSDATNARDIFRRYAEGLGLNGDAFAADLDSKELKDKVAADVRGGISGKVNSTPTFFLNGERMTGFNSYDEFFNLVREAVRNNP